MSNFDKIRPLSAAANPPTLPSGTVRLYRNDNWGGNYLELSTNDYQGGVRHSIMGMPMQDAATFIAFNLPVGTVMTMVDDVVPEGANGVADLSACGATVDLVGTGQTVGVNLVPLGVNDCLSGFFWREVDTNLGAIEFYDGINFEGNCVKLFLSDFARGTLHNVGNWYIQDRISSVRWPALDDRLSVSLFDNEDGSGQGYNNINGWGGLKEIKDLRSVGFNDRMSSFKWDGIVPMKEVVDVFNLPINVAAGEGITLTSRVSGTNDASTELPITISLADKTSQTVTISNTDTVVKSTTTTVTLGYSWGSDIQGKITGSLSVAMTNSYSNSNTTSASDTKTIEFTTSQTPKMPAFAEYDCQMTVQLGRLHPGNYATTATRWYDRPVSGAIADPANNNWYRRTERLTFTMQGGFAATIHVDTHEKASSNRPRVIPARAA